MFGSSGERKANAEAVVAPTADVLVEDKVIAAKWMTVSAQTIVAVDCP